MSDTFEYNGAVIRVRRETIGDRLHAEVIQSQLAGEQPHALYWAVRQFASFCTSCKLESGELPFAIPTSTADSKSVAQAFDDWLDCDADLIDAWINVHGQLNIPKAATGTPGT